MDPESLLEELCRRHGVAPRRGARLLPLVRWALKGPDETRERILAVVEETLAGKGRRRAKSLEQAAEEAILTAVARVLHDWTPSEDILDLDGGGPGGAE